MFKTQFNAPVYNGKTMDSETNYTVPDDHLTIQQLLINHTKGLPVQNREPHYFEDTVIPNFTDIEEIAEYKRQNKEKQKEIELAIKTQREAIEQQRLETDVE